MSKSNSFETEILSLLFNGTAIANIADDAGVSPLTNLYVGLHTSDPGEAGTQSTNETAYTGYARVAVARTSGGWTITGNSVSPVSNIEFPICSASPGGAITHVSIGELASGAGRIFYSGALSPTVAIAIGVIPRITNTSSITED